MSKNTIPESLVQNVPGLADLLARADHVDVKTVEGSLSMRAFIGGMLSYYPAWLKFLYGVRWFFVRLLGMRQEGIPHVLTIPPEDVTFEPGEKMLFFTVAMGAEERYWLAHATESHLAAYLGVIVEPLVNAPANGRRFHVITLVHYRNWAGPIYFNVIRPFHHLVVGQMVKAGIGGRINEGDTLLKSA